MLNWRSFHSLWSFLSDLFVITHQIDFRINFWQPHSRQNKVRNVAGCKTAPCLCGCLSTKRPFATSCCHGRCQVGHAASSILLNKGGLEQLVERWNYRSILHGLRLNLNKIVFHNLICPELYDLSTLEQWPQPMVNRDIKMLHASA